ncbi:hypothetical protein [Bacillus sp. 165]|uniref:hypothetical protein n=1 Tax=Bacillus sp. 165 TaxID=1529117 RepID=UPI001ADC7DC9|nr:hypothetical protein [Bacillus sp. 165]MBO9129758.1 hypothetical protein [Bacillus sp. 165]
MKIIQSSPRFTYMILTIVLSLYTYGVISYLSKGTGTLTSWIGILFIYIVFLLLYVYIGSMRIIIYDDKVSYTTLFESYEINLKQLTAIEFSYLHKNAHTMFPVLHIYSLNGTIEIPSMMFERDIQMVYDLLIQKKKD